MKNSIKIIHPHLETPLIVSEEFVQLLIIENPNEFYKTVSGLYNQFDGAEGEFIFLEDDKEIAAFNAGEVIINVFDFELNDKKLLNMLYKRLEKQSFEGGSYNLLDKANESIASLMYSVFQEFPFSLVFNELAPADLFKLAGVKFEKTYDTFLEKIICYINAVVSLKNNDFFVFVNLKSVLNDEELDLLYKHCSNEKIGLLLIESSKLRDYLEYEKAVVITADLCEILENYKNLC